MIERKLSALEFSFLWSFIMTDNEIFKETEEKEEKKIKRFEKFSIRDFVFLAICSAAALLFSSVMPLVAHVPVYGVIQMVVSIQTALFLSLGLFKVRKHGALLFMAICSGIIQVFMAPVMFFMSVIAAFVIELFVLIFKGGYHHNFVRYIASTLFIPIQMPGLWIYYSYISKSGLPEAYLNNEWWFIALMILAVIALSIIGTIVGNVIGKELQKAGVLDGRRKKE